VAALGAFTHQHTKHKNKPGTPHGCAARVPTRLGPQEQNRQQALSPPLCCISLLAHHKHAAAPGLPPAGAKAVAHGVGRPFRLKPTTREYPSLETPFHLQQTLLCAQRVVLWVYTHNLICTRRIHKHTSDIPGAKKHACVRCQCAKKRRHQGTQRSSGRDTCQSSGRHAVRAGADTP
jgi:hypothetical protein